MNASIFWNARTVMAALAVTACASTADAQLRPMIYAETTVETSAGDAFSDWTTAERLTDFFAATAQVEAEPGGTYELCFAPDAPEGQCGNDDGRILALQPDRMLAFTWAMPPYMPEIRPHLTSVQILFEPIDADTTRVRLFHTGFGSGEAWAEGRDYFAEAWPAVLRNYREDVAG